MNCSICNTEKDENFHSCRDCNRTRGDRYTVEEMQLIHKTISEFRAIKEKK